VGSIVTLDSAAKKIRPQSHCIKVFAAIRAMPRVLRGFLPVLLILATASQGAQTGSAIERFRSLRDSLRQARSNKDWRSSVENAQELERFLNQSPESLLESARAELHRNDLNEALRKVQQFVKMGQVSDLLETSEEFARLRTAPSFPEIAKGMRENRSPVSLALTALQLSDPALLAEDLDYEPVSKRFFITSVREKKIVVAETNGIVRDFAKAPDDWPMLAIKIDPARQVLWATEVALQGFVFAPKSDWGRSAVLRFDLQTGKVLRRIEGPPNSALGDMTLAPNGDAILSDGEGGGVYRVSVQGDRFERSDGGDFISPQTPAMHPDGRQIFVPDYVRGIGVLDLSNRQVHWISTEGRYALNGIDGLYCDHGVLIAVQNGAAPERVVAFAMNAEFTKVASEAIFERSSDTLGDPTHGVIVDGEFYYIANSGWDVIDDHGNIKPDAKLSPARIMRVPLKAR
jgi:hypothetical protein